MSANVLWENALPAGLSELVERRESRSETNWIAMIRLLDGAEIPCTVKDVSRSGAKLGVPSDRELPDTFMLKILGRDFVCLVKLAWRRGNYAGVRIERVGKLAVADRKSDSVKAPASAEAHRALGSRQSRISSF